MFQFSVYHYCIRKVVATSRESIRAASRVTPSFLRACQLYCRNGVHSSVTQCEQNRERKGRDGPAAHVAKEEHKHGSVLLQFVERKDPPVQLTVGAKGKPVKFEASKILHHLFKWLTVCTVVQAGKDFTYVLVILGGFIVTGFLFWTVGSEFFSSSSTSSIFSAALNRVKADPRVSSGRVYIWSVIWEHCTCGILTI